jgi:class 3 adenylate cyclase/HD superfamily phosphodiesterase
MRFVEAKKYLLSRLQKELKPNLYYHGIHHTIDVYEAVKRIAMHEKVSKKDLTLLKTAALFHDIGFIEKYKMNEDYSAFICRDVLPNFGYSKKDIEIICNMILSTTIPQCPKTLLEEILCDADLDYLGRDDFYVTAFTLQREWNEYGIILSLKEWHIQQLRFITNHKYFTKTAIKLREEKKFKHLLQIKEIIDIIDYSESVIQNNKSEKEIFKLNKSLESLTKDLEKTNSAYSKFVPSEFLSFLDKANIVDLKLGDHIQKEMTILFSDIRSFTNLSESMLPSDNFNFINSYLKRMAPCIRRNNGFVDKYMGDSIMALFGNEPKDALVAAIESQLEVKNYNKYRASKNKAQIKVGIGLHTGDLMLGIIGEERRMEGTVISDNVNLASRMEGLTKAYNANIIISENVLQGIAIPTEFNYRFLDKVKVKGKVNAISVFEVFSDITDSLSKAKIESKVDFEYGIFLYQEKRFYEALKYFSNVFKANENDKAAIIYINRCENMLKYGVPPNWEAIFALSEK